MDYGLAGKPVIVSGASKGIGKATAHAFLHEGANVAMSARNEAALVHAVNEAPGPGTPLAITGDITEHDHRKRRYARKPGYHPAASGAAVSAGKPSEHRARASRNSIATVAI